MFVRKLLEGVEKRTTRTGNALLEQGNATSASDLRTSTRRFGFGTMRDVDVIDSELRSLPRCVGRSVSMVASRRAVTSTNCSTNA
jgi:hypothetical protein